MGTIILLIAFVIEVAFATYCLITKSNQQKVRSYVRIGAFTAFVLFTLVAIIQWDFRWYGLALLLIHLGCIGCVGADTQRMGKKNIGLVPIVFKAIGTLLLVIIVLIPALIFPQYQLAQGDWKVRGCHRQHILIPIQSRIETFTTTGENRKVNVEFWYPKNYRWKIPVGRVFSWSQCGKNQ